MVENTSSWLTKRLRYLWTWELFDSFFIPADVFFIAWVLRKPVGFFSLYGMGVLMLLLWQGSAYWYLKLQEVRSHVPISRRALRWFAVLKWVNWVLLAVAPLVGGLGFFRSDQSALTFDLIAGLCLYVLAVLEQINYYYYQLMYDCPADWRYLLTHRKLKRASLGRALAVLQS